MSTGEPNWDRLFDRLIGTPLQIAIVCTGGGSGAVSRCFRRAGASRNFVDAAVPYSLNASEAYLGFPPRQSRASQEFAQQLALAAYDRAIRLSDCDAPIAIGIALVAVMPTVPTNTIEDRIHVALHNQEDRECWSKILHKGEHSRESAESIADEMIFKAIEFAVDHR